HYGPEFRCALLNEQPMGFYPPDALVHEAQRRGIAVLPPCVLRSGADCSVEDAAVRIGLGYVNGVRGEEIKALAARAPYRSIGDLASRAAASAATLARLAWAGAGNELSDRRRPTWERRV